MNTPRYALAAARLLKRRVEAFTPAPGDRARGLTTIDRAMRARARRRRWSWSLAAVAAAAAAAFSMWRLSMDSPPEVRSAWLEVSPLGEGAMLRTAAGQLALRARSEVGPGSTIETAKDGGAALQLPTGSSLLLSSLAALRVNGTAQTERFTLERGSLSAQVAKLTSGRRFVVGTPDAEVEVRGTRFSLRVLDQPHACGFGSRTRLEVTEGIVEVRASGTLSRVSAGQKWPADCAALERSAPGAASASQAGPAPSSLNTTSARSAALAASAPPAPAGPSGLTRQNDLFAVGVALRRQGDVAGALRAYQDLLNQFPASPLAENAMVERMRLLATAERALATEEARRYLRRYPRGFARDEAQRLMEAQ